MNIYRDNIINHLKKIKNLDNSLDPIELICGWFDDLYFPNDENWCLHFSVEELNAMSCFNNFFDNYVDAIPDHFSNDSKHVWANLSVHATTCLHSFEHIEN
nr:hypothetical protein [uncultured Tolumonas sp.]